MLIEIIPVPKVKLVICISLYLSTLYFLFLVQSCSSFFFSTSLAKSKNLCASMLSSNKLIATVAKKHNRPMLSNHFSVAVKFGTSLLESVKKTHLQHQMKQTVYMLLIYYQRLLLENDIFLFHQSLIIIFVHLTQKGI